MTELTGTFELPTWQDETYAEPDGEKYATVRLTKTWDGGIVGSSEGRLLQVFLPSGAAAYVGIERVDASVDGRKGTFVLQHTAAGDATGGHMAVTVVPGSGTGELAGLTGTLSIERTASGEHTYALACEWQ